MVSGTRRLFAAILAAAGLVGCGQSDRCTSAKDFYCDGAQARNCDTEEREYMTTDCGARGLTCALGGADAFCALSSEPDERCEARSGWCTSDNLLIYCKEGYATRSSELACEHCVEVDTTALCPQAPELDPRCPDEARSRGVCSAGAPARFATVDQSVPRRRSRRR